MRESSSGHKAHALKNYAVTCIYQLLYSQYVLENAYLVAYVFFIWPLVQKDSSVSLPGAPCVPGC